MGIERVPWGYGAVSLARGPFHIPEPVQPGATDTTEVRIMTKIVSPHSPSIIVAFYTPRPLANCSRPDLREDP